ncbi:MAG: hypothetical protein L3K19_01085 [Thermoplasmata archaeon]|nr:hypothetical protein [Thermoplasmata archaeon]
MATPSAVDVEHRLAELDRQIRELRGRIAQIERRLAPRSQNPLDREATREKVTYDWQS